MEESVHMSGVMGRIMEGGESGLPCGFQERGHTLARSGRGVRSDSALQKIAFKGGVCQVWSIPIKSVTET